MNGNKKIRDQGLGIRDKGGFTQHHFFSFQKNKNGAGFTLIEILVVLGLFSILSVVIINVFLLSLRSQRQASFRQKTLASLRYTLETIARQVRTSEVNYDSFTYTGDDRSLYLIDQLGSSFIFSLTEVEPGLNEVGVSINGQTSFLTDSTEVNVVSLSFLVTPIVNPFIEERCNQDTGLTGCSGGSTGCTINDPGNAFLAGFCGCNTANDCGKTQNCFEGLCLPINQHPRVTIVLGFESISKKIAEQKLIYLQTTASSRVYKR